MTVSSRPLATHSAPAVVARPVGWSPTATVAVRRPVRTSRRDTVSSALLAIHTAPGLNAMLTGKRPVRALRTMRSVRGSMRDRWPSSWVTHTEPRA